MKPIYLFLDLDGVLHLSVVDHAEHALRQCDALAKVLDEFPQVQVIVSSQWRQHHDLEGLRRLFGPFLGQRLIGVTPLCLDPGPRSDRKRPIWRQRFQEIAAWLAARAGDDERDPLSLAVTASQRCD